MRFEAVQVPQGAAPGCCEMSTAVCGAWVLLQGTAGCWCVVILLKLNEHSMRHRLSSSQSSGLLD